MTLSSTWFLSNQYFIPHRLMLLARMIDRETATDLLSESNLSAAEWRALGFICTMGSSSAAEICVAFEVDRAEVSRAVRHLAELSLIRRAHARDHGNRVTLTPTASGTDLYLRTQANRRKYFDWILQDLDTEQRQAFDDMLSKIAGRVDERRSARTEGRQTDVSATSQHAAS